MLNTTNWALRSVNAGEVKCLEETSNNVCLVLRNSECSIGEGPAPESPSHMFRLPAWAQHAECGKQKQLWTSLSLWSPQLETWEEAFCNFVRTCWWTNSSPRELSTVGDFLLSLSSLFPTVLAADFVQIIQFSSEAVWIDQSQWGRTSFVQWQICWKSTSPSPSGSRYF